MRGKPLSGANTFVQCGRCFHGRHIQFFGKRLTTESVLFEGGVALSAVGEEQHTLAVGFFSPRFQRQQELVERQSLLVFAMLLMQTDAQVQSLHEEIVQMAALGRNLPFENRGIVERETVEILSGIEFKRFIQHKHFVRHRGGHGRCVHERGGGKIASKSRRIDPVREIVAEGDGFSGDIQILADNFAQIPQRVTEIAFGLLLGDIVPEQVCEKGARLWLRRCDQSDKQRRSSPGGQRRRCPAIQLKVCIPE
ncbi:MAG: hypothetical protein R3A10_06340 [Caldilineaceae bacterium]